MKPISGTYYILMLLLAYTLLILIFICPGQSNLQWIYQLCFWSLFQLCNFAAGYKTGQVKMMNKWYAAFAALFFGVVGLIVINITIADRPVLEHPNDY